MARMKTPVIARVQIALAAARLLRCDIVVAADDAVFAARDQDRPPGSSSWRPSSERRRKRGMP
jgi:hypothetical protein